MAVKVEPLMGRYAAEQRKRKASSPQLPASYEVKRQKDGHLDGDRKNSTVQSCCVVVDGRLTVNSLMSRGYLRPKARVALLPYFEELDTYVTAFYNYLITGAVTAVLVNEPYPGLYQFLSNLNRFVQNYGLRFTIPEAIRLIKFLHLVMTKPGQYREIIYLTARMLDVIIGMSRLTYRDMTLDWRPVFHLYYHAKYGKIEGVDAEKIQTAVYKLKRFYPLEESKLIWEELQVYLSPRNDDKKFFDLCLRFLPTQMNAEEHRQFGAGFWWDSLWKLYEVVEMGAIWGDDLPYLFAQVFHWAPDFRDISPIYEDLFIRILRSMQLVVRGGKIAVGDGTGTASILAFADLVGDLLGGPNSCQPLLSRLMKCLEAFMHPSNADEYSKAILVFMNRLCESVRDRVYEERIKKHKRPVPTEYYLKDEDITLFVESMLQTTLIAIYNEISFDKFSISKILMGLSALKPDLVIPRFLEHTYPALDAVCEPHRLLNTLECLVEVVYQIAADQSGRKFKDPLDHWVEQDSNVPDFYPFVSEHIKSQVSNELRTIRPHLIYLLEALTCAIDINDVAKTSISLQNMNLIFLLVPNIDCSSCIELRDDLTEDEKFLCQLTARLPALTDNILEKILDIIRSLSVCAPKNSTELLGGLKDETTATGEEEKNLRRAIDCCINALLCNSSPEITAKLIDKIFEFVACNEFDSAIATELATGVVAQAVFVRPENWPRFAQYVLKNLRSLLTPEVRRQKDLSSTALWFINLASALFCTTSEAFVRNKAMCFEFIELLTDCECKFAHDIGCQGMWYALYMLSRIYTIQQQILGDQFSRSLKDWVPIRDWGMTYQEHEISLAWHVPDESRRDVVAEILSRFMFPLLEKMRTTKVSVHDLRRYLKQVNMAYCGAVTCLPMPNSGKTDPLNISDRILPFARFSHAHVTNKYWDIPYIDGSNVRETLFVTLESLLENMTFTEGTEDTQALISITNMLRNIIDDKGIDAGERSSMTNQTDYIFSHLNDPMMNGKKLTVNAFDSYLYKIHLDYVCADESLFYYPFHRKVFDQLVKLALNDYPEVRDTARTELNHLVTVYYEARIDVVEKISLVFVDKNSSVEKIKAALDIVRDNKWISNCQITEKTMLWPALIKIPVGDRPTYNMAMDDMYAQLLKQNTVERDESESQELLDYTKEWWTELPKTGLWEKFTTEEQIDWAREKRREAIVKLDSQKEKLVSTLIELFYDKSLHHTRIRLARAMLWKFQRSKANAATIKIILSKMLSDDVHIRDRCADELAYWMRKNKPKTKRIQWLCPERSSKYPDLLCGIREDNLCVAYDSKTLPNTAEKWQSCIFISKQSGCHKWPSTLSVPAPEPSLQRGPLCEAEKLIAIFFEHKENIDSTIELLILDKEETQGIDDNIFRVVKYVLRNFPDRPKILENFLAALKKMLSSRKHTEQRAAADIFCGVVKGTKHYPFETLNSMWKWLAPAIDRLIDHLNSEAETCWMSVFPMIFGREDPRRFFWLIEQILLGMQRPAPSAYHQAVRSGVLPAKNWRDVEIRKRITDIAWKQLPTATMEMQRVGISNALRVISTIEDANLFNDFAGLPERFRLRGTDYWLEKFMEKIESLVETPSSTKSEPQSSSAMEVELKQALSKVLNMAGEVDVAGMRSLLSESNLELLDEDEDRQGRIYLRCCLEFLLQYYEECMTCLTPGIVKLIPTLLEYSNDDESSDLAMFKDHDIVTNSSVLIHDYMSGLLVNEKFADSLLHILIEAYERTCLWRAKVSVLKFFQVIVFSNVFTYERGARPQLVANLVYSALADEQIEVRQEAARCLETLIHFDYIKLDQDLLNRMENMLTQDCKWQQHGGILGYSAIVGAFPFSTPALVVPAIRTICQYSSRNAQIQVAATKVLREFRSSHRDNWTLTCKTLGPDLVYQIENVIAPVYYA